MDPNGLSFAIGVTNVSMTYTAPGCRAGARFEPVVAQNGCSASALCVSGQEVSIVAPNRVVVGRGGGMSEMTGEAFGVAAQARPGVIVQGVRHETYPEIPPMALLGEVRRVTEVGEAILASTCAQVTEFDTPELHALLNDMFATQYASLGVGLAANQIDVDLSVFVYDITDERGVRHVGHVINPIFDGDPSKADETITEFEGCLSVPGASEEVARAARCTVRGFDVYGAPIEVSATGYFARCLQHETDHLNGRLYLDHLSRSKRRDALAEMREERDETLLERSHKKLELEAAKAAG